MSDVVTRGAIPNEIRQKVLLWVGCIAGALDETEYKSKLNAAGFEQIEVEPTRVYKVEDACEFFSSAGVDVFRAGFYAPKAGAAPCSREQGGST